MTTAWNYKDLTGRRFGRLVAIRDVGRTDGKVKRAKWLCRCDCGNEIVAMSHNLVAGHTQSCGCYRAEIREKSQKSTTKLYIAYGSNLDTIQMRYRCPGAKVVCKSTLHGYKLVFQGRPYCAHANVIPDPDSSVPVVVWKITKYDEEMLDRYEGVRGGYYTREFIPIDVNGKEKKALIYIMTPNPYGNPMADYYATLVRGYRKFKLPLTVLHDAMYESASKYHKGL